MSLHWLLNSYLDLGLPRARGGQVDQLELAEQAVARGLAVVALVDEHRQLHLVVVHCGEDLQPKEVSSD